MEPMEIGFTITMPCGEPNRLGLRLVAVLVLQEHGARGVDGLPGNQEKKLFEMLKNALAAKRTWHGNKCYTLED